MTDKDKIKFAISYLKKGLKSKRTPPLYEELMNELGFEKKDKVSNLASVAVDCYSLHQEIINRSLQGEILNVKIENDKLNNEIAELKAYNEKLLDGDIEKHNKIVELQKENAELRKIAEFQQSSNMETHFENKKLKEVLAVGSTWNKGLNSRNKYLEEQNDKYRNMVFDKMEQLDKAKEIIKRLIKETYGEGWNYSLQVKVEAEKFLKECE